jgi:hypothetical protein
VDVIWKWWNIGQFSLAPHHMPYALAWLQQYGNRKPK